MNLVLLVRGRQRLTVLDIEPHLAVIGQLVRWAHLARTSLLAVRTAAALVAIFHERRARFTFLLTQRSHYTRCHNQH